MDLTVNFVPVLAAAVVMMVVGALWYSPVLFANQWMKELGKKKDEVMGGENAGPAYGLTAVGALLMAFMLSVVINNVGSTGLVAENVTIATLLWLGFVVPTFGSQHLFGGYSLRLYLITVGHYLFAFVGAAIALSYL